MISTYLDDGPYGDAAIGVWRAAFSTESTKAFIKYAGGDNSTDLVFLAKSTGELEAMDKGAGAAEALTGLFFAEKPVVSPKGDVTFDKEVLLSSPLSEGEIAALRTRTIQVRILVNSDKMEVERTKRSLGWAMQVLAHECAVHAVKYLPVIQMLRGETSANVIKVYLGKAYTRADTLQDLATGEDGALLHVKQHLLFATNKDADYEALRSTIVEKFASLKMNGSDLEDFQTREESDKAGNFDWVRSLYKKKT